MKNKGFVTVATGSDKYYWLAANLYLSYKKRGSGEYPFALICDRENEYSAMFDDVILVDDIRKSTVDKLLMRYSPYRESIFIDADTLILRDIDDLWDVFADQDDVSVFGCTLPLDSQLGWFTYEGSGKYKPQIRYLISMNGGIYYFRKTERAHRVFQQALDIIGDYDTIDFKYFDTPQDEPLMAMSMVLNGCVPCTAHYDMIILPACENKVTINAAGQVFENGKVSPARMLHFSTPRTELFMYHYLNTVNHPQPAPGSRWTYLQMKLRFFPKDLKFSTLHLGGAILRKYGLDHVVEKLKNVIR